MRHSVTQNDAPVAALHPREDDTGHAVWIQQPHQPSHLAAWADPEGVACVVPGAQMPAEINGLMVSRWNDAPTVAAQWEVLAAQAPIKEPDYIVPAGYRKAAGAVIQEPDGRVWLVAPSNAYGGYEATFPKGTMEGNSAQATALMEVFEECGLRVRLKRHLIDVQRSLSYTRYYLAERLGGCPADMGWESQAVLLAPVKKLAGSLNHLNDLPIVSALIALSSPGSPG